MYEIMLKEWSERDGDYTDPIPTEQWGFHRFSTMEEAYAALVRCLAESWWDCQGYIAYVDDIGRWLGFYHEVKIGRGQIAQHRAMYGL